MEKRPPMVRNHRGRFAFCGCSLNMCQNLVAHLGAAYPGAAVSHHVGGAVALVENSVDSRFNPSASVGISKL